MHGIWNALMSLPPSAPVCPRLPPPSPAYHRLPPPPPPATACHRLPAPNIACHRLPACLPARLPVHPPACSQPAWSNSVSYWTDLMKFDISVLV